MKDDIVGLAWWSVPAVEMCDVFSTGTDVKGFMLEMASSDGDEREGSSLARGRP